MIFNIHRLQYELPEYLFLFATHTFVSQRQLTMECCLHNWYSFENLRILPLLSKFCRPLINSSTIDFINFFYKYQVSFSNIFLKVNSRISYLIDTYRLHTFYTQQFRITLAPSVLPRMLARSFTGLLL